MIKRLYNYQLLPELPEKAKEYKYIFVDGALWASNMLQENKNSITRWISPYNGCSYHVSQDGSAWEFCETYAESSGIIFSFWSLTGDVSDAWVSPDIPDKNGNIVFRTSDRGTVEYGFWDGGEGDALEHTNLTLQQGYHVAGVWKCIVSGTDSPVAKMEWYRNKVLVSTKTGRSESEYRPSADTIGTFNYKCVITFENGKSVTAGDMTMVVEAYDPGEDPGGGGDNPGGGGGGGGDETSLVTGIDLNVYPDTVVPGGHATIEVSVNGIGNYSQAFTARLSGHASSETELFSAGHSCNVWVAEEETAEYVLVTVTSVQDPNITATEMIYIDHSGTGEEGTTQEQLQKAFWKGFAAAKAYFRDAKVLASASIHIAREEAEPTAKEGKLRRSFWQGFVSALIVSVADTVPAGVLVSSDGYILKDSRGRYLYPKKQLVAYLYNGVRLPALPIVSGYDHAYLCKIWTDSYKVAHLFLTAESVGITDPEGYITSANVRVDCMHFEFDLETGMEWEEGSKDFFMYQQTFEPFWANTDMEEYLYNSGELGVHDDTYTPTGEIGLYASDPVPVYE